MNRQTNATENRTPVTTFGVGNDGVYSPQRQYVALLQYDATYQKVIKKVKKK